MEERIQKIIAHAGIASRREAEAMIEAGLVSVNGKTAHLGQKADPTTDTIKVHGKILPKPERLRYFIVHKPRGVLSAAKPDPQLDRPLVTDYIRNVEERLYPVGRLDLNSEGLVLLTNDGTLTNEITHPRYGHEKTYKVLLEGEIKETRLDVWRRGVTLPDGYRTAPCRIKILDTLRGETWIRVIMRDGHKHQIRTIADMLGHPVKRLIRTHIGPLAMGDLPPGHARELSRDEIAALKRNLRQQQQKPKRSGTE